MPGFLSSVAADLAGGESRRHAAHAWRVLRVIAAAWGIPPASWSGGRLDGFTWFHERFPDFPVWLDTRTLNVDLVKYLRRPLESELHKEFGSYKAEYETDRARGLIVRADRRLFVYHDWTTEPQLTGVCQIMFREANNLRERNCVLEPLPALLDAVQRSGWHPDD